MKASIELILGFISILTFLGGVLAWYSGAVQKRYAAQRDFEHLKRSFEQLVANQSSIIKDADRNYDQLMLELKDVKGLLTTLIVKISPNESVSEVMRHVRRDDG